MAEDLGARLVRAGLVTRAQLAGALAVSPVHGGALALALVRQGVLEDAIAGFFIADGFGPLLDPGDLEMADPSAASHLDGAMAAALMALPVRSSPAGLVVAMADPTDDHAVAEIRHATGREVVPTVTRVSDLTAAIERQWPGAFAPETEEALEEASPIELVRRRTPAESKSRVLLETAASGHYDRSTAPDERADAKRDHAVPVLEDAVPLVRTKAVGSHSTGAAESSPVVAKTFGRPAEARSRQRGSRPPSRPPRNRHETDSYARPGSSAPPPRHDPRWPDRRQDRPNTESYERPGSSAPPAPPLPEASEEQTVAPSATGGEDGWGTLAAPATGLAASRDRDDRAADASGKLPLRARHGLAPPGGGSDGSQNPPDMGSKLAAMRSTSSRDEVVRLACECTVTVSRAAVFLALRKGTLKGWDGEGGDLSGDAVRNLWIPATSPSIFRQVLKSGKPHAGPHGQTAADTIFRAATGSRGGDLLVQPVILGGRVVGLLCVDDARPDKLGRERVELIAQAVSEAFKRIIVSSKNRP